MVQQIIDYVAAVWGVNEYSHIKTIKHRAGRYFLGLGQYAPNNAVVGEMGWNPPSECLWRCVFRQWRRLSIMSELKLNARVHAWARRFALGGTKNDSYKAIKFSRALGAWDNDAQCVKEIAVRKKPAMA